MDDIGKHGKVIKSIGLLTKINLFTGNKFKNIKFYRSILPDGYYDKKLDIKNLWKKFDFTHIISLINEEEYFRKTGKDQKSNYFFMKKSVYNKFSISTKIFRNDNWIPKLYNFIKNIFLPIIKNNSKEERICVHCSAGVGRTGMFYCCILLHFGYNLNDCQDKIIKDIPIELNLEKKVALKKYYDYCKLMNYF
jgi:hypothetical protein